MTTIGAITTRTVFIGALLLTVGCAATDTQTSTQARTETNAQASTATTSQGDAKPRIVRVRIDPVMNLCNNANTPRPKRLAACTQAIENAGENAKLAPLLTIRGTLYARREDYRLAIQDATEALRLDPDNASAYSVRGFAYNKTGEYRRALEDYSALLRIRPNDKNGRAGRAFAASRLGRN
jgi:Flp pilus assembly protein TadD